jgi:hypothetical protein
VDTDLDAFHALRQDLLLEVAEQVAHHGGQLAVSREPGALRSAPGAAGRP